MNCLNCGKEFVQPDNYCSSCGQAASAARMETHDAFHNLFHAFTHTDKGFFYLVPQLRIKPGFIAREYTLGKRKKYFNPFSFMILVLAINTILISSFNLRSIDPAGSSDPIAKFLNKHFNIIILIALPLMSYFTALLYRNKGINFAESMVLGCYTSGERSIIHIVIVAPLIIFFREHYTLITLGYSVSFAVYYAWACCQYFNDYKFWTFIKGILTFVLCQIIIAILIGTGYTIYLAK